MTPFESLIRCLDTRAADFEREFAALEERREDSRAALEEAVDQILDSIRTRGDAGLLEAIERFDGYALRSDELWLDVEAALAESQRDDPNGLGEDEREALRIAAERIHRFHAQRVPESWQLDDSGGRLGQLVRPLERVGLYVPAGSAPLASTLLMLAVPARVAGVREVVVASPGARPHPAVLEAARLAGVARILRAGGAHAVGALAFGTASVPRVDKILGPGNDWVQTAKRRVFGQVGIDAEAGPSEVMIVADSAAPADWVVADLLAQAEHDPRSSVVLATPSEELLEQVCGSLEKGLADLPRQAIAREALRGRSALIRTRDLDEAVELANRYAAEHLQLMTAQPEQWLARIEHAGAVFAGNLSSVPAGDYVAGPSHVLPTGRTARFFSVVGVEDFLKRMSWIELSRETLTRVGPHGARLAELEGLEGHARSLRVRLDE